MDQAGDLEGRRPGGLYVCICPFSPPLPPPPPDAPTTPTHLVSSEPCAVADPRARAAAAGPSSTSISTCSRAGQPGRTVQRVHTVVLVLVLLLLLVMVRCLCTCIYSCTCVRTPGARLRPGLPAEPPPPRCTASTC